MIDLCHVRGIVVGADKSLMDLSLLSLVIAITPLHLMVPDTPPCRLDVRALTPPDNIGVQLVGCREDQLVLLP